MSDAPSHHHHRRRQPHRARALLGEATTLLDSLPASLEEMAALVEAPGLLEELLAAGVLPGTPEEAFEEVLSEAEVNLASVAGELDAEMWGSEMLGAFDLSGLSQAAVEEMLGEVIVPMAEAAGTPTALALVTVLAALGRSRLAKAASDARGRLVGKGVPEPPWSSRIGAPAVGPCWVSADVFGEQEALSVTFRYGRTQHALCVLVDHSLGGGVKDCYVAGKVPTLRRRSLEMAEDNPVAFFEDLEPKEAARRLQEALARRECPQLPDQVGDVACTRALLRSRTDLMTA